MSTKITIHNEERFHIYQEMFDTSNVHLDVYKHSECSEGKNNLLIHIEIPIESWRSIVSDWNERGWPKEQDKKEKETCEEWLLGLSYLLESFEIKKSN